MTANNKTDPVLGKLYLPSLINGAGHAPILFICEHATNYMPDEFAGLGLDDVTASSHAAWDPGALDVACQIALKLNAPLISASVSRLLFDCNRSPEANDAIPQRSEIYDIPGNQNLSSDQRKRRVQKISQPFYQFINDFLNSSPKISVIVTLHSFTPTYNGVSRAVDIGLLHDKDETLANAILSTCSTVEDLQIKLNEPYSSTDGVTHTLREHGTNRDLLNVMIEVKNDLIRDANEVEVIASHLSDWLVEALHACDVHVTRGE